MAAIHQPDHAFHQVVHVAEGAGLAAVAVEGERLAAQGLHDEVAHHPAVIGQHARPVGVEDAHHADLGAVHALVVETEGFGDALALVVTAADADRVHAAAVALGLGVHLGVAIHLGGAGQQQAGTDAAGQAEHVVGTEEARLGGLDRVELVVHRRGGAGQMPDAVHLQADRIGHVVADQLKAWMADPLADVLLAAGEVVVEADHLLAGLHQPVHQVGAHETGTAGHQVAGQGRWHGPSPPPRSTRSGRRPGRRRHRPGPGHRTARPAGASPPPPPASRSRRTAATR